MKPNATCVVRCCCVPTIVVVCPRSPDGAKIKQKMVYSSSKDALKRALGEGIGKEVQANDHGDLDWNNVKEIISRMDRN